MHTAKNVTAWHAGVKLQSDIKQPFSCASGCQAQYVPLCLLALACWRTVLD